ncbi:type II toxin-antitoxin system HicA family toxin [Paramicrobacterium fandaimingii]|uniref:type II toxin-antitoxin system HicA family toxin n=1 Tax=Paramicrobacterium fandaimingii TaxID=2708079 RepID=UPI001422272D|nr:type II toxin-antitoxin system HicA family toxin [Microbacterium fandaimingii]
MKHLKGLGWIYVRNDKGSHEIWGLPDESVKATIPVGHRQVSAGVLRQLEKRATARA